MKVAAFLLALAAAVSWGFGGIMLKRGTDIVSPAAILVVQYATGLALVAGYIVVRGGVEGALTAIGQRWGTIIVIALLQIGGYLIFVAAVTRAGPGSLPTSTVIAIAAAYPALVAALSGPLLGEALHWNHALAVALIVSGVVVAQAF